MVIIRTYILSFLFCNSFVICSAQQIGKIVDFNRPGNGFEKAVLGKDSGLVIFGFYLDTNDVASPKYDAMVYPCITTYPQNKFISLRKPFSWYFNYGADYGSKTDQILQLNDSQYAYTFYTVDTGQEYKSSRNWLVIFDWNGDTIRLVESNTAPDFEAISSYYIPQTKEFLYVGEDSNFYVGGNRQSLYKVDSMGQVVWRQKINDQCGNYFWSVEQAYDNPDEVILSGNISYRPNPQSICLTKYYFKRYNALTGAFISANEINDSIPDLTSVRIDGIRTIENGPLKLGLGIPRDHWWSAASPEDLFDTYHDEQQLLLFDQGEHLLNRKLILSTLSNKDIYNIFKHIVPLQRNKGTIVIGYFVDSMPNESHYGASILFINNDLNAKWNRTYQLNSTQKLSRLVDVCEDKDGSFWFIGHTRSSTFGPNHGWIVKTDSFGCVEPGCQLHDAINELDMRIHSDKIFAYPNPSNGTVNIRLNAHLPYSSTDLLLVDQMGRVLNTFEILPNEAQIVIDTKIVKPGIYYLILKVDGCVEARTKMMITH